MKKFILMLLIFANCAWGEEALTPKRSDSSYLTFLDSKLFDGRLYAELQKPNSSVVVVMPGQVTLTNFPARLDRWVSTVGENGKLSLQETAPPEQYEPRAIFGFIPLVFTLIEMARESQMYGTAKKYNATIYYHKTPTGDSVVDRIEFTKKP